jgi:sialate O-acetylesterase
MQPLEQVNAKWALSQPSTTKNISAVGYWFLSSLQKDFKIPIGFINVSYGGTPIESWLSKEALKSMPFQDKYMDADVMKAEYDEKIEKIQPLIAKYERMKDSARLANLPTPPRPAEIPTEYKGTTTIYNGEIFPLLPLAVKGIAWYQGENNAYTNRAHTYEALLTKMIALWRADFQQRQLPFIIIQLPGYKKEQDQPTEHSGIAMLREAQLKVSQKVPYTCLVTTSDCGDVDVHYTLKEPVGYRVYQAALHLAYGRKNTFTGPLYQSYKVSGNSIVIDFTHKGSGLTINTKGDEKLYGFAIAGEDKKFYWANAVIKDNKVVVSSPQVAKPVAVRYGWADFSEKWNLFNKEGYPASTFRTDHWELK